MDVRRYSAGYGTDEEPAPRLRSGTSLLRGSRVGTALGRQRPPTYAPRTKDKGFRTEPSGRGGDFGSRGLEKLGGVGRGAGRSGERGSAAEPAITVGPLQSLLTGQGECFYKCVISLPIFTPDVLKRLTW